jgi:hypothetical protein
MRKGGIKIQRASGQIGFKRAQQVYELAAVHIDSDLRAAASFAQLALALSLLGLVVSLTALRAISITALGLDLLTAGS